MKKLNKFFAILVSLAMMATLCVCMAFAAPNATGTEETPATAAITKEFKMPVGTTTPAATFTFEFTSLDGAPAIADKSVTFAATDTGSDAGDVKTAYKWTENFADVSLYDHAGRYEYTVKEKADTYAIANAETEKMTYSQAEYKVTIDVANGEEGLYIKNVAVQQTKADDGTAVTGEEKVDPSVPGTDDADGNGFKFSNKYVKTQVEDDNQPDPEDPDHPKDPDPTNDGNALFVQKKITGDLGDKTKKFDFSVKVTAPSLSETTSYAAEIIKDGKVIDTLTFTSGAAQTVQLAHDEKLVFNKLDVGAAYEVTEAAAEDYEIESVTGTAVVDDNNKATGLVKESADNVIVTNKSTKDDVTPTGILISNLPYIALALVAIGGLVAYVVVRRRNADEA